MIPGDQALHRLRWMLGGLFAASLGGLGIELILTEHTEGVAQKVPLVLLGAAAVTLVWAALVRNRSARGAFAVSSLGLMVGGCVGLWMHYRGSAEFALELNPGLEGPALWSAALYGTTAALAPGALIALGVLGLAWLTVPLSSSPGVSGTMPSHDARAGGAGSDPLHPGAST